MAAGTIPRPGSKLGPCNGRCAHRDCKESRRMAAAGCARCLEPIGYDTAYFMEGDQRAVHALCKEIGTELDQLKARLGVALVQNDARTTSCAFCRRATYDGRVFRQLEYTELWVLRVGEHTNITHKTTGCLPCWGEVAKLIGAVATLAANGKAKAVAL